MAAVSVTANNTRVDDAEASTGWANIGGGQSGAAEGAFPYQGSNLFNRRVTGTSGFYYDPTTDAGSAVNMTLAASNTWIVKAIVTDYGGLNAASGLRVRIGSGTTAYHQYVIAGTNAAIGALSEYPPTGGLIIIAIDPNVAAYRDSTSGSPALTAVDYFGLEANFTTSSAKSENVGLDAIDVGTGLTLTGGDGGDPDGVFQDFVDEDEGITTNRWGYATARNGIINVFGTLTIGSATATVFTDNDARVLFPDGLFAAGYAGIAVDLQNASTSVTVGSQLVGLGSSAVEDSRPDYTVTGTSGTHSLTGELLNFRNITFTSAVSADGASIEAASLTQGSAEIQNATLTTNTAAGVAFVTNPTLGSSGIHDSAFVQGDAGHAIEITTPGAYTLDALTFSGYGADGTTAAAIYNNSGGSVTLNILNGGSTPTVRNGTGASTTVNNSVTVGVTVLSASTGLAIQNARVRIEASTGGPLADGTLILEGLTDSSGRLETTAFNFTANQPITGRVRKATSSPYYKTGVISGSITSAGFDSNILLILDE